MTIAIYITFGFAFLVMGAALGCAFNLHTVAKGGRIGRTVRVLIGFISVFLLSYAVAPFLLHMNGDSAALLSAAVFLLGAIFVIIVLRIVRNLIQRVFQELDI